MFIWTEGYVRIILSIIVLIVLIVIIARFRANRNPAKDSLDILKERYEKGEVSKEDYEDARKKRGYE